MGWWRSSREGDSLMLEHTGLFWGDGPADILDNALDQIVAEFYEAHGRKPTCGELRAGLEFSLMKAPDEEPYPDGDPDAQDPPAWTRDARG